MYAQKGKVFQTADSITYSLYLQGQWQSLIKIGNQAIAQGHDYFYMRMRVGIAYYMQQHYRKAAGHFEKALLFNSRDKNAANYLLQGYQWSGLDLEAASLTKRYSHFFQSSHDKNYIKGVSVFAGGAMSGIAKKIAQIDLDQTANIYGEISGSGRLRYAHLGFILSPATQYRWYLGYTHLQLAKHQRIIFSGTDTLDNNYTLFQHQLFISLPFRISNGLYIIPSFNLININDRPYVVKYVPLSNKYTTSRPQYSIYNYTALLKLVREMPYFSLSGAAGHSYLNNNNQWQGALGMSLYPYANLNLYTFARFSAVAEDHIFNWHYKLGAGGKILPGIWLQGNYAWGYLKNTFDDDGSILFNTSGTINSKAGITAYLLINKSMTLQFDYSLVRQQDSYISYLNNNTYTTNFVKFNNHHIMGGLKWKL